MVAEFTGPDIICVVHGEPNSILHHLLTQKSYPEFRYEPRNLLPLCLRLHNEIHAKGTTYMAKKYSAINAWLNTNGWHFDDVLMRWQPPFRGNHV